MKSFFSVWNLQDRSPLKERRLLAIRGEPVKGQLSEFSHNSYQQKRNGGNVGGPEDSYGSTIPFEVFTAKKFGMHSLRFKFHKTKNNTILREKEF